MLPPTPQPVSPGYRPPALPDPKTFDAQGSVPVRAVTVDGATIYSRPILNHLTDGLISGAVPLSTIEQARQSLVLRYRRDGYLLTTVSATVDAVGTLHFNVVEGRIVDVKLDGDIGPAGTQVLRFLERLKEEQPISNSTMERYLLLAGDVPGVTLHSVLQPTDEPGALVLVAQISRQSIDGLATADNRAFRGTGPEQLLTVAHANSFSQLGERTEVSILHSFNNTQTFGQASTEVFAGSSGLRVKIYGGAGEANPSGNLRAIGYDGQTRVFGTQATYPVIRSRQQTLSAYVAFDALESNIDTDTGLNGAATRASFDSLRILRAGLDYALEDTVLGAERPGINGAALRLSRGLTLLGATKYGDPQAGRVGSRPDFFKANAEISRTQTLFHPWNDASVALFGLVAGQISNHVLPNAEKFFLGGIRYNRGFYSGEVTGDNAVTTSVELQLNEAFETAVFGHTYASNAQFYVFDDWGETWENQRQDANRRLHSAGGGVRLQLTRFTEFGLEGVKRFTTQPQSSSANVTPLAGDAAYWRVLTRF